MTQWHSIWTGCARLSCAPPVLGAVTLVVVRGTTNWVPLATVFLGCWVGLALALSGLFGLIALRQRSAEEHLPWSRSTFYAGVAGLVGSLLVGSVSVVVLSDVDVAR